MKREHNIEQSYIDWLKSLGCLVWMPLHGDLQDKISGVYATATGSGAFQYDAQEDMTLVTTPSSYGQVNNNACFAGFFDNGIGSSSKFPTDSYTLLCKCKRVSTSGIANSFGLHSSNNQLWGIFTGAYNGTQGMQSWPNTSFYYAYYVDSINSVREGILNGEASGTASIYAPQLPSNWSVVDTKLAIGYAGDYSRVNKSNLVSDFYLFNTVLDLQTIRKIQGI